MTAGTDAWAAHGFERSITTILACAYISAFVLAALRALHLDPDCGSTAPDTGQNEAKKRETTKDHPLPGVPNTDKDKTCEQP